MITCCQNYKIKSEVVFKDGHLSNTLIRIKASLKPFLDKIGAILNIYEMIHLPIFELSRLYSLSFSDISFSLSL